MSNYSEMEILQSTSEKFMRKSHGYIERLVMSVTASSLNP